MEENKLLEDCLRGSRKAQFDFYAKYKGEMYAICLRYASSRDEANDMLQEGFIRAFQNLDKYEPRFALIFWLRKVILNACLMHLRKNKKHRQSQHELSEVADENERASVQDAKELIEIIQRLPLDYRVVFNLYSIEGYSHKEIAEIEGISIANSKVRLSRARAILQKRLKHQMRA